MKKQFQSHIPDTEDSVSKVWEDAIIVFDANTLLNLYRYSDKSRSEFVALLQNLKDRIWTPEQAAHEYFKNRATVIADQSKAYDAAKKSINDLRDALRKDRAHPFIADETMGDLTSVLEQVETELDQNKEIQASRIPSDEIMADIVEIFDGRVGEAFSADELEAIYEDGETRYGQKIPPGYKDIIKHKDPQTAPEKRSVYGDLIVWKQIIAKAKKDTRPVIFVTDDTKEDWWHEAHGKTIGPRIELLDEFHVGADQKFYMYRPDQFLKHAKDRLQSTVSSETIDEIRATDIVRSNESIAKNALRTFENWKSLDPERQNKIMHRVRDIDYDQMSKSQNLLLKFTKEAHRDIKLSNWTKIDNLQSKLRKTILQKLGINRNIEHLEEYLESGVLADNEKEASEVFQRRDSLASEVTRLNMEIETLKTEIHHLEIERLREGD